MAAGCASFRQQLINGQGWASTVGLYKTPQIATLANACRTDLVNCITQAEQSKRIGIDAAPLVQECNKINVTYKNLQAEQARRGPRGGGTLDRRTARLIDGLF